MNNGSSISVIRVRDILMVTSASAIARIPFTATRQAFDFMWPGFPALYTQVIETVSTRRAWEADVLPLNYGRARPPAGRRAEEGDP